MTHDWRFMVDKSFLTEGYITEKGKDGFYAEFYPSGQLKHFGRYRGRSCNDWWQINLEDGKEEGSAKLVNGSGGTADYETYKNGTADRHDAWSDNSRPHAMPFERWVKEWIKTIY